MVNHFHSWDAVKSSRMLRAPVYVRGEQFFCSCSFSPLGKSLSGFMDSLHIHCTCGGVTTTVFHCIAVLNL